MATSAAEQKLDKILAAVNNLDADLSTLSDKERKRYKEDRERQSKRYQNLVAKIGGLADRLEGEARAQVLRILSEEQDVTGPDNPAQEA